MKPVVAAACSLLALLQAACSTDAPAATPRTSPRTQVGPISGIQREDGARKLSIPIEGSLQNPAWSPDGSSLLITVFQAGYNLEPADLVVVDLAAGTTSVLVSDGSGNVNLPGASWNPKTGTIVFSSSRDPHDEIYTIADHGTPGDEIKITDRPSMVAYEPSQSPDGQWIVFESHALDEEGGGRIVKYGLDGTMPYQYLTRADADCRQPNWSPSGEKVLYQKYSAGQWDIWTMDSDGTNHQMVTRGRGDKTDASFSPDGKWIVYSASQGEEESANLFITSVAGGNAIRLTHYGGYDGAPSWSPDGKKIVFESCPGDPDNGPGTALWIIDVPALPR